jgi:peroxiredoxin
LADFQSRIEEFNAHDIVVVAASVDKLEDALATASRHDLTFPVAYGLDAQVVAAQTGAYWEDKRGFLHATGFIVAPNGMVAAAVYSTGPVGRYTAQDALAWTKARAKIPD